jgi:hypothetical protein
MRFGRFESSGFTRLMVLRRKDVMIAYRTPFNPLPPLSENAKYLAAKEGRTAYLMPYGIDIWRFDTGKVMSLGWHDGQNAVADHYRPGDWETMFERPKSAVGRLWNAGRKDPVIRKNAARGIKSENGSKGQ